MPLPSRQGLYDPAFEHDACGLGFVATLTGQASHGVVTQALEILTNLTHRGAAGSDPETGDGAGILLQLPHALFADRALPEPGAYAVAMCFFSADPGRRRRQEAVLENSVRHHRQRVLGWRDVPVNPQAIGAAARRSMPVIRQLLIGRAPELSSVAFERVLYMIRKRAGRTAEAELGGDDFYVASCSSKTVVYKGLMLAEQVAAFYPDLSDARTVSRLAVVHSRFSTNTFPTWERAHPFRLIAHNGEINTLSGNRAWMRAREALLASLDFGAEIEDFKPIVRTGGSDSAALDNVVDFLVASGRSLPHVMMMLVPKAYAQDPDMSPEERAFYEYHACLVEPWDGPAALTFTDGDLVGAVLDRNGLRPAKWVVTHDGLVVLASELGVLELDPARITQKGRVQPGRMFLVDTRAGRLVPDEEIKHRVATRQPYRAWLDENGLALSQLPAATSPYTLSPEERTRLHKLFGWSEEDVRTIVLPMASGEEPVGSMGADLPLAVLSQTPQLLFRYFKQQFAQVTNPPIDPIREETVMSLASCVGAERNILDETARQCRQLALPHPILSSDDLARLRKQQHADFRTTTLPMRFGVEGDPGASLERALEELCTDAERAIGDGASIVILSDRGVGPEHAAIPSLLATAALHHHLLRRGLRVRAGLVVETGEAREVHHLACLIGFGASAVNPYLALDTFHHEDDRQHYVKALKKGLLKVMAKMGISAVSSYQGAQVFEAIGLDQWLIDRYFTGVPSRIRGIGLAELAEDALARHRHAYDGGRLAIGGQHFWRRDGEPHLWTPGTVTALQKAVRNQDPVAYADYARQINDQSRAPVTLRSLWDLVPREAPVPLDEVEPAATIVRRFATGAMSFGSISKEAHETLAIAMNRLGGKSNTGEGGEDPDRFIDERRSAIKQVASGRFGVTADYLVHADEIQIKMAQGAKPGEGGQLPGHKVDAIIARVRHSTPGVTLISPPPHHDIYSIEDLAQLIFDLRAVNPRARISVKLVATAGVGTIAAGVAKAHADVILISGHDGGTGASPLTAIHHAGAPWELGLAEAQQVLVMNGLRERVVVQCDGQLKTGRDVAIAALLGAEEFGFATAPLVATGCIMMRKCHLNTCPVGVATQDPELRRRFTGQPEHVMHFMIYVAEELREIMAGLGFRSVDDMVGRVDCIAPRKLAGRLGQLDFAEVLHQPREHGLARSVPLRSEPTHDPLVQAAWAAIDLQAPASGLRPPPAEPAGPPHGTRVRLHARIRNRDRAFGTRLAGEIAHRHGAAGLAEDSIVVRATGSAGQSFGAFATRGLTLELEGDANDYVGKGLSGGVLVVKPPADAPFRPDDQVIVGNTVLYGATSGRAFFCGRAGERFGVRNSGATCVVEGIGDHGCEYMTGGTVIVLGTTGRNFAAGMSGGVAYVFDEDGAFVRRCNPAMIELHACGKEDSDAVRDLVEEHALRTGSPKAHELLDSWAAVRTQLVEVVPRETLATQPARSSYVPQGAWQERQVSHG